MFEKLYSYTNKNLIHLKHTIGETSFPTDSKDLLIVLPI